MPSKEEGDAIMKAWYERRVAAFVAEAVERLTRMSLEESAKRLARNLTVRTWKSLHRADRAALVAQAEQMILQAAAIAV